MGFASRARVKLILNIPDSDTSRDAEIDDLILGVDAELLDIFQLDQVDPKTYTEVLDVVDRDDGQEWIRTHAYPVIQVVSVQDVDQDDPYASSILYTKGLGQIFLSSGTFRYGRQTTRASFIAGFQDGTPARAALEMCANQAAALYANTNSRLGIIEEQIGKYRARIGGGVGGSGALISRDGLPMSWGRIMTRYVRVFP